MQPTRLMNLRPATAYSCCPFPLVKTKEMPSLCKISRSIEAALALLLTEQNVFFRSSLPQGVTPTSQRLSPHYLCIAEPRSLGTERELRFRSRERSRSSHPVTDGPVSRNCSSVEALLVPGSLPYTAMPRSCQISCWTPSWRCLLLPLIFSVRCPWRPSTKNKSCP